MDGTLKIRCADARDSEVIIALIAAIDAFHQPFDPGMIRQGQPLKPHDQEIQDGLANPAFCVLVCEIGQQVVGYARMEVKQTGGNRLNHSRRVAIVHEVSVAEPFRGMGSGTALMQALHEYARKANVDRIRLEYYVANRSAAAFYEKLGYKTLRVVCVKDS